MGGQLLSDLLIRTFPSLPSSGLILDPSHTMNVLTVLLSLIFLIASSFCEAAYFAFPLHTALSQQPLVTQQFSLYMLLFCIWNQLRKCYLTSDLWLFLTLLCTWTVGVCALVILYLNLSHQTCFPWDFAWKLSNCLNSLSSAALAFFGLLPHSSWVLLQDVPLHVPSQSHLNHLLPICHPVSFSTL